MESWRKTWRDGVEPLVSTEGLEALRRALTNDDPRLLQGATSSPPPPYNFAVLPQVISHFSHGTPRISAVTRCVSLTEAVPRFPIPDCM